MPIFILGKGMWLISSPNYTAVYLVLILIVIVVAILFAMGMAVAVLAIILIVILVATNSGVTLPAIVQVALIFVTIIIFPRSHHRGRHRSRHRMVTCIIMTTLSKPTTDSTYICPHNTSGQCVFTIILFKSFFAFRNPLYIYCLFLNSLISSFFVLLLVFSVFNIRSYYLCIPVKV